MRQRFDDVRTIERMLVAGQLDDARTLAFMLTRPLPGAPQAATSRDLALAAGALANARTIDEALHAEVRVAIACARCHASSNAVPVFRMPSNAPPDQPTVEAQMTRYQWAVDRLWESLLGASDEHWRAGLYVMATAPFPGTENPELATRLQQLARAALDMPDTTLDARGARYAELLVTCAGCHALVTP